MIIKKYDLALFLFFITIINVLAKSISIPFLSESGNKLEIMVLLLLSMIFLFSNSTTNKVLLKSFAIFSIYVLLSIVSSLSISIISVLSQTVINFKFIMLLFIFSSINLNDKFYIKITSMIYVFSIFNVAAIFLEIFFPNIYSTIFSGVITDTIIQGTSIKRYSGVFVHPGPMGIFFGLIFIVSILKVNVDRDNKFKILAILSAFSLIMSGQRMEGLAVLMILTLAYISKNFGFLSRYFIIKFLPILVLFCVIGAVFYISILDFNNSFNNYDNARLVLYLGSFELANDNFPLGEGLSTFGSSTSVSNPGAAYGKLGITELWWFVGASYLTDTFWAMIIGESGWFGLVFYLLFLFSILMNLLSWNMKYNGESKHLHVASLLFIYGILVSINIPIYTGAVLPMLIISIWVGQSFKEYELKCRSYNLSETI